MDGNLATPWKLANELRRLALLPSARLYFALHGVRWRQGWRIYGLPLIQRQAGSQISAGDHLQIRSWLGSNPLGPNHRVILATRSPHARLTLGDRVGLTGTTLVAEGAIDIGHRVRFGANTTVVDTDFHPLDLKERLVQPTSGETAPVVVEDDAFIGMSVLILKGSHIGRGAVIGAGSVVSGTIPPYVVAAGNPARVVRELERPVLNDVWED